MYNGLPHLKRVLEWFYHRTISLQHYGYLHISCYLTGLISVHKFHIWEWCRISSEMDCWLWNQTDVVCDLGLESCGVMSCVGVIIHHHLTGSRSHPAYCYHSYSTHSQSALVGYNNTFASCILFFTIRLYFALSCQHPILIYWNRVTYYHDLIPVTTYHSFNPNVVCSCVQILNLQLKPPMQA